MSHEVNCPCLICNELVVSTHMATLYESIAEKKFKGSEEEADLIGKVFNAVVYKSIATLKAMAYEMEEFKKEGKDIEDMLSATGEMIKSIQPIMRYMIAIDKDTVKIFLEVGRMMISSMERKTMQESNNEKH